jgi:hypothetical protein
MKRKMSWLAVLVALGVGAGSAGAVTLDGPLSVAEQAACGANWIVKITHADLTQTNLNDTQVLESFTVGTNWGVELVAVALKTAFSDTATNAHNSTTLTVGDGDDADRYVESMELNGNGTEVWLKFPRESIEAITSSTRVWTNGVALVGTTVTYTNAIYDGGATTGNLSTVTYELTTQTQTNLVGSTLAQSEYGRKVYTVGDTVDFSFTSMSAYSLSELDAGEVWVYLKVTE